MTMSRVETAKKKYLETLKGLLPNKVYEEICHCTEYHSTKYDNGVYYCGGCGKIYVWLHTYRGHAAIRMDGGEYDDIRYRLNPPLLECSNCEEGYFPSALPDNTEICNNCLELNGLI